MKLREVKQEDAAAICEIFNYYVANTIITFDEAPVSDQKMRERISETTTALPWFVAEESGEVLGFAFASTWKGRCAYRYSAETTAYVKQTQTGKGIGKSLYGKLISALLARSLHSVIGGIALPNRASVALHEKFGFVKAAHFKEVGRKFDQWIDVGYWKLQLPDAASVPVSNGRWLV